MRRTTVLWEIWVNRFEEAHARYRKRRLNASEAGEMLGLSERHFRRLCRSYEEEGVAGLADGRIGKASPRRAPAGELARMCQLYRERYADFTVKHFHEHLGRDHGYRLSYTLTRLTLQKVGLVEKGARRAVHRKKRARRPQLGMLLFQDGSTHRWIAALDRDHDLIVTLDDATGRMLSAFLVEQEGTMSSLQGLAETIARFGLFGALYTDRGSHYFHTPKSGGRVDKTKPTQVGRALAQLAITHIASYSPEARGRMERLFGTVQNRLPQELRLAGITTVAAANRFIAETFIDDFNARFAVAPADPESAFLPYVGRPLEDVLCVQDERRVGRDNCVTWDNRSLQIPPQPHRHHYVKAMVRVHAYPDGRLAIFDGPRRLALYDQAGAIIAAAKRAA